VEIRESDLQDFSQRAVAVVGFVIEKYDEPDEPEETVEDQPRVVPVRGHHEQDRPKTRQDAAG